MLIQDILLHRKHTENFNGHISLSLEFTNAEQPS